MKNVYTYFSLFLLFTVVQINGSAEDYSNELAENLVVAVRKNDTDAVKKLIQAGTNVNQTTTCIETLGDCDWTTTYTIIEYAAIKDYVEIVKELIKAKTNIKDTNKALVLAAKAGNADIVAELLQTKLEQISINQAFLAAAQYFPGIYSAFSDRRSPQYLNKEYQKVLNLLLKAGADINFTSEYGDTALFLLFHNLLYTDAQRQNRAEILQDFLNAGAQINCIDKYGETILMKAVRNHDVDAVNQLLKVPKIDINYANKDGNTALIVAINSIQITYVAGNKHEYDMCINSQKIAEALFNTPNIDMNHINNNGETALTLFVELAQHHGYC